MPRIFISYRREETAGYAGRLRDRLVQHFGAERVFMDVDTIELGVDFGEVIEQAVAEVDVFLCVMGPEWATITDEQGQVRLDNPNDFVRMEVASAIGRDIRVIPVLVRNAVVPTAEQLPSELAALTRRNALQLTDTRFHADVDRLVEGLRKLDEAGAGGTSVSENETPLDVDIPAAEPPKTLESSAPAAGSPQRFAWKGAIALLLVVLLIGGAGYGWHQYSQEQQRLAQAKAEAAKREAALREERAAIEEARRKAEMAAELAARQEAARAERDRLERERAEAELQARREAQEALERQQAERRAEEQARARAREQAEVEARRKAELAAAQEARRREAQAEAERVAAAEAERRREAQIAQERAEARRQAELEARARAQREAEAAERRRNEALKVRAERMVDDIARLYDSHKTADNCGVIRRIATTLERYFETHYPLPDGARVSVRYPRRIDEPKVSDLARDRNLRIRRAKPECF